MTNEKILEYWETGMTYVTLYSHWEKVHKRSYQNEINKAIRMMYALELCMEK